MHKFLVMFLFVVSIGLFGWTFYAYTSSGEEVAKIPVSGLSGTVVSPELEPGMSPVRLFMNVDYEAHLEATSQPMYSYEVAMTNPGGDTIIEEQQLYQDQESDQGPTFDRKSLSHVIGTASLEQFGTYKISWQIVPKKAKVNGVSISLRRNVEGLNIPLAAVAGFCFLMGWIVLFLGRKFSH